ncbi:MAG: glycosyltransferase family 2 protein [Deltaproteobacteria bacterium]|nr:glycosyltransferase family 2 protein [Deltaproteobacteria bacterium]
MKDKIVVVIPALNEEATIGDVITGVRKHARHIVVVDGHSYDGTADIARSLGVPVIFDHGKGKGDAIRSAIPFLTRDITVFIDADGSHDPDDIPRLVRPVLEGKADLVTGSRVMGGSDDAHGGFKESIRIIGCAVATALINHRFGVMLSETQNGFRSIRTEILMELDLRENTPAIEQEIIIKTLKKGYRIGEVPSHEYRRKSGHSKIRIRKIVLRHIYSIIKLLYG